MKNKIFSSIFVAALCGAALSVQAFAADITEYKDIYAEDAQQLAAGITESYFGKAAKDEVVDPDTVIPVYFASLYDPVSEGKIEFSPKNYYGEAEYIADVKDSSGEFAGVIQFVNSEEGFQFQIHGPKETGNPNARVPESVDFHLYSEHIKAVLLANNINTDVKEIKLAFIEGLGFVYYIDNGTIELFYPAKTVKGGVSRDFFEDDVDGIVIIDDEFRAKVAVKLEEQNNISQDPNFVPLIGGGENPSTGGTSSALAVELGIALTACVIGVSAAKKKKDQ